MCLSLRAGVRSAEDREAARAAHWALLPPPPSGCVEGKSTVGALCRSKADCCRGPCELPVPLPAFGAVPPPTSGALCLRILRLFCFLCHFLAF
eukprot:COSAG04_NODE_4310_length_2165_cov_1.371733_4_plen_93_part_00